MSGSDSLVDFNLFRARCETTLILHCCCCPTRVIAELRSSSIRCRVETHALTKWVALFFTHTDPVGTLQLSSSCPTPGNVNRSVCFCCTTAVHQQNVNNNVRARG